MPSSFRNWFMQDPRSEGAVILALLDCVIRYYLDIQLL
jgi:hypothetical protein